MSNARLSDEQWDRVLNFLRQQEGIYIGNERDGRRFVETVLWVLRSGAQWRWLPADQGRWNSVYRRFARWGRNRMWDKMLAFFSADADLESIMLESTVVRAQPTRRIKPSTVPGAGSAAKFISWLTPWAIPCGSSSPPARSRM